MQDRREGENFSRLRVVPAAELNADALANTTADIGAAAEAEAEAQEEEDQDKNPGDRETTLVVAPGTGEGEEEELTLVDSSSGQVVARTRGGGQQLLDDPRARQRLTPAEIEEFKRKGASAGHDLIAKLLLSHTAIDQKTGYSLAKYKLLKTKKYIRRFTVLPLDVPLLAHWMLEDKDAAKILEMRQESMALVGCWADVHYTPPPPQGQEGPYAGRWLVADDTAGLLTASLAERMGILHPKPEEETEAPSQDTTEMAVRQQQESTETDEAAAAPAPKPKRRIDDLEIPYAPNNSLTLIHHNSQPNLSVLRYFGFDHADVNPSPPYHPLFTNLTSLSWLQLLSPEDDPAYADTPPDVDAETLASWKTNQRGNYHRKRRRWARTRHIVDSARAGGFSGLAVASTMDPVSVLRHALPLLAGGAPIAIYSQTVEPLAQLADCFSVGRRAAWVANPPAETEGQSTAELERWGGSDEFPINPTLLLGASVQTSRARRWQVLPQRTHPVMTERGGAEGYIFTGWRAVPVEGKIEARGKFRKKR